MLLLTFMTTETNPDYPLTYGIPYPHLECVIDTFVFLSDDDIPRSSAQGTGGDR